MFAQGTYAMLYFDDWIVAPDGREYKSAWGPLTYYQAKDVFGFIPKGENNWFVQVGHGDGALIAAGCRIHYAFLLNASPEHTSRCYVPPSADTVQVPAKAS